MPIRPLPATLNILHLEAGGLYYVPYDNKKGGFTVMCQFILIIPVVFLVSAILPFITAIIEKRKVWPYSRGFPFEPFELSAEHDRFLEYARAQAQEYGFTFLERGYDNKGPSYRIVYDFLISKDGYTLALLGAGALYKIRIKGAWLFSKTPDGHAFVTITNQSADEYDLSGMTTNNLILTTDVKKAYRHHIDKINAHDWAFEPFTAGQELEDLRRLRYQRLGYMEQRGWIRFLGNEKDQWKYTVRGGLKWSIYGVAIGMAKFPVSLWKGIFGK